MKFKKLLACILLAAMTLALLPAGILSASAAGAIMPYGAAQVPMTLIEGFDGVTDTITAGDTYGSGKPVDGDLVLVCGGAQITAEVWLTSDTLTATSFDGVANIIVAIKNLSDRSVGFAIEPNTTSGTLYVSAALAETNPVKLVTKSGDATNGVVAANGWGRGCVELPVGFDGYVVFPTSVLATSASGTTGSFTTTTKINKMGFFAENKSGTVVDYLQLSGIYTAAALPAYNAAMVYGSERVELTLVEKFEHVTTATGSVTNNWGTSITSDNSLHISAGPTDGIAYVDVPTSDLMKQSDFSNFENFVFYIRNNTGMEVCMSFQPNQRASMPQSALADANPAYRVTTAGVPTATTYSMFWDAHLGHIIPQGYEGYLVIPKAQYNDLTVNASSPLGIMVWGSDVYENFYIDDMYICGALPAYEVPKTVIPCGTKTAELTLVDDLTASTASSYGDVHGTIANENGRINFTLGSVGHSWGAGVTLNAGDYSTAKYLVFAVDNATNTSRSFGFYGSTAGGQAIATDWALLTVDYPVCLIAEDGTLDTDPILYENDDEWGFDTVSIPVGFKGYAAIPLSALASTHNGGTPVFSSSDSISKIVPHVRNKGADGVTTADPSGFYWDALYVAESLPVHTCHDDDADGACNVCSEVLTATWAQSSISMGGDIGVNFYFQLADEFYNDATAKIKFTVAGEDAGEVAVQNGTKIAQNGNVYYVYTCNVSAKQMTDTITAQAVSETATLKVNSYTVAQYAEAILAGEYAAADKALATALLNYGAAAQTYFAYNTDALANASVTDKTIAEVSTPDTTKAIGADLDGITFAGFSALFQADTTLRFYFRTENIAVYTFNDGALTAQSTTTDQGATIYYVDVTGIAAADMDSAVSLTVSDGNATQTIQYSVESYMNDVVNGADYTAEAINLVKAACAYGQAADAYLAQ